MKQTLREQVEQMLNDLVTRQGQLRRHIAEYKEAGEFESAMKCDIKLKTLETVRIRLVEALS